MTLKSLFGRSVGIAATCYTLALAGRGYFPSAIPQALTWLWPETTGTIVSSRVLTATDEGWEPLKTPFALRYRYKIGDREYESTTYRLGPGASQGQLYAEWLELRYPPGRTLPVFYQADQPALSVLERGWTSEDALMWLVLVPLGVMAVLIPASGIVPVLATRKRPETGGLLSESSPDRATLFVTPLEPWLVFGALMVAVPIAAVVALGLAETAFRAGRLVDLGWPLWGAVIGLVVLLGRAAAKWLRSRHWRVTIDRVAGEVCLPDRATRDGEAPASLPLAQVSGFRAEAYEQERRKLPPRLVHLTLVEWNDADTAASRTAPVLMADDAGTAEQSAKWLNARLVEMRG